MFPIIYAAFGISEIMKFSFNSALLIILLSVGLAFAQEETGGAKGKIKTISGNAIADASVTARQNGKDIKSVKSDSKGNFILTGLEPGVYNFVFERQGFGTGIKYNVEIEKKKVRDLGSSLILSVDAGSLVFIKGSVFKEDGRSFAGAEIKIERIASDGSTKKVGSGYTDIGGEFAFRFPEGSAKYRIIASAKGVSASKEVEVSNAAIYRVAITLKVSDEQ